MAFMASKPQALPCRLSGNEDPTVRKAALNSGLRRVPDKAIFSAGVDGTAQESLGRVLIDPSPSLVDGLFHGMHLRRHLLGTVMPK